MDEALTVARQIADALEAAHENGIIHRDLKPANIKVRPDGTVKVLDFGLAKAVGHPETRSGQPEPGAAHHHVSRAMTQAGMVLGTAAYMAPEQARGHAVDRRADIWAFGCVLFEMLTGRRAFGGDEVADTIAAVVRGEPDWAVLPGDTPASIRRLLRRCLEKDRKRRLADAADARLEIEAAHAYGRGRNPSCSAARSRARRADRRDRRRCARRGFGRVARDTVRTAGPARGAAAGCVPRPDHVIDPPVGSEVAIAPDGSRILYVGQAAPSSSPQLFVRTIERGETSPIAGTEQAQSPFFSPDGEMVAFVRDSSLLKVGMRGGSPTTICSGCAAGFFGGAWAEDGTIVFGRGGGGGGLLRVRQTDKSRR